jgi:hypothetical protein
VQLVDAWADNYTAYDRYDDLVATRNWNYDASSVIGGGTLGCSWQPVGSLLVPGLEGEVGNINLEGSAFNPLANTVFASAKVGDWYGIVAGRLDCLFDRAHVYVKGGAAFLNVGSRSLRSWICGLGQRHHHHLGCRRRSRIRSGHELEHQGGVHVRRPG